MSSSRVLLLVTYVALWAAALTAPAGPEPLMPAVVSMLTLAGPDPWTAACFNLMGLWPLAFAGVLLRDGPEQRVPSWPFVLCAFAGGMFALMPYLLLRREGRAAKPTGPRMRALLSRGIGSITLLGTLGLVSFAAFSGAFSDLTVRTLEDGFTRTFMADFAAFWLASFVVLADDVRRFDVSSRRARWAALPLLGLALHLLTREPGRPAGAGAPSKTDDIRE